MCLAGAPKSNRNVDATDDAKILQILEVREKNNRLAERRKTFRSHSHPILRIANQRIMTDFSTSALCHELLHPIALSVNRSPLADDRNQV